MNSFEISYADVKYNDLQYLLLQLSKIFNIFRDIVTSVEKMAAILDFFDEDPEIERNAWRI